MDTEAKRIIGIIEEIEIANREASILDYEISIASPKDVDSLQEQFKRYQRQSNDLTNDLKSEGIEIEWDGISIFVKKDGNPYLQRDMFNSGEWEPWTYQLPLIGREEEQDRALRYLDESNRQR